MIAEIGHFALILALAVAAFQTLVPLIGAERGQPPDDCVRRSRQRSFNSFSSTWPLPRSPMPI